jgi:hypothetical protein
MEAMDRLLIIFLLSLLVFIPQWGFSGGCTLLTKKGQLLAATPRHYRQIKAVIGEKQATTFKRVVGKSDIVIGKDGKLVMEKAMVEKLTRELGSENLDMVVAIINPRRLTPWVNRDKTDLLSAVLKEAAIKVDPKVVPVPSSSKLKRLLGSNSPYANERLLFLERGAGGDRFLVTSNLSGGFKRLKAFIAPERPPTQFTNTQHIELVMNHEGVVKVIAPTQVRYLPPELVSNILFGRSLRVFTK